MILLEEVIIIRVSNPNSGFMKQLERMIEKYECESRKVTSKKRCLTFEKIKIYPDYHQVILDEKEVTLTGKEFQILLLLAENRGQVFSKKRIYETIWQIEEAIPKERKDQYYDYSEVIEIDLILEEYFNAA